ncbi:WD repeat-containing protein 81 [Chionoecetes opilio]|uniref:WD repeat-containing protein 81 n=1 Tax=Chionoecetes opilio TaxID=41210 RepID=A0A8J4YB42_CHIOP|nr:WD repeat-containing protein 81 [Chionoecetes opilio]
MQDSAPAHRSKVVQKFLTDNNIPVLDWPGNSPDLNPIENAWNEMKKAIAKKRPTNINELKQALTKLWVEMDLSYFTKLATSMPKRIGMVIQYKGNMTNPAKLRGSEVQSLFVLYQLLEAARDTHDRGLHLGDVTLSHLYVDDALYLSLLPCIPDSLIEPESLHSQAKYLSNEGIWLNGDAITPQGAPDSDQPSIDSFKNIPETYSVIFAESLEVLVMALEALHKEAKPLGLEVSWLKTKVQVFGGLLDETVQSVGHQITTLDYLLCLNFFAGRRFNVPNHHPTVPWVTDFSSRTGGWRDLTKTKFRLNKGDQQLDQTYQMATTHGQSKQTVAHHVTEVFSEITYYVYKARVTSKELLTKYVRQQWVPEHYPSTMSRLYEWTPDETIPEFYTDSSIFKNLLTDITTKCRELGLKLNVAKSKAMAFGCDAPHAPLYMLDTPLSWVTSHQYLGIWLDNRLNLRTHVAYLQERENSRISVLRAITGLKGGASCQVKRTFYIHAIRSLLDYSAPCLISLTNTLHQKLEATQNST